MPSLNRVTLMGHLGHDPELKFMPSGQAVANFSLATTEKWKGKDGKPGEKTEWHRIVVFGKTAENCKQYLAKGRAVYIEGKIQTREWEGKDGEKKKTTEIIAHAVQFLGSSTGGKKDGSKPATVDDAKEIMGADGDDIPF